MWTWFEHRTALNNHPPGFPRTVIRAFYDFRLTGRHHGVGLVFSRVGPLLDVTPWLNIGVNYAAFISKVPPYGPEFWEQRLEAEANFVVRSGPLTFSHRDRFEYRWRENWNHFRLRFQVRASVVPSGFPVGVFLWEEVLFDPNLVSERGVSPGFLENRAGAGVTFPISPALRIDVGYVLRARQPTPTWELDHVFQLSVAISAPRSRSL